MNAMSGQLMILFGIMILIVGLLIYAGFPLGRLPGDFHVKTGNIDIYFPLGTSLLVSVVLTAILAIAFWLSRR